MKNKSLKVLTACAVSTLITVGCGGGGGTAEPTQQATLTETPQEVASFSVQLKDANGNVLPNVAVTIDDNSTGLLEKTLAVGSRSLSDSTIAEKTANYTSDQFGFITVALAKGTTQGDLTITIKDTNYFPLTQIYSIEGESPSVELKLTKRPAAGESIAVTSETGKEVVTAVAAEEFKENQTVSVQDASGNPVAVTGSVAQIETKNNDQTTGQKKVVAEVLVPSTVQATTDNGVAASGQIKVDAAVYENTTVESMDAFPGGFALGGNLTNATDAGVPAETATETPGFITAGFVALEVKDAAGNDITKFNGDTGVDIDGDGENEKGLLITTLVPKSTVNPETGKAVAKDEKIPVWSYNDQTGKWTFDGNAKIFEEADNENWRARFAAEHLTFWNLDYYGRLCYNYTDRDENALIEFKNPTTNTRDVRNLEVRLKRVGSGWTKKLFTAGDGFVAGNMLNGSTLMEIKDRVTGENIPIIGINGIGDTFAYNSTNGVNLCTNKNSSGRASNDIYLQPSANPAKAVDINIKVVTSCTDSSLDSILPPQPVPSAYIYSVKASDHAGNNFVFQNYERTDTNGTATLEQLNADNSYYFYTYSYKGGSWKWDIKGPVTAGSAANPVTLDLEQKCNVTTTTGSAGGN